MADKPNLDPSTESKDYKAMKDDWKLIDDILAGIKKIRASGITYLPKYPDEDDAEYEYRLKQTPWRAEFEKAVRMLSSKPFEREVSLQGEVPAAIKEFAEDVDGGGRSLHEFAKIQFENGGGKGVNAIFVDYPTLRPGLTLAEEREIGARPYWLLLKPESILALEINKVNGKEVVTHLRFRQTITVREPGTFEEVEVERIRVLEPGKFQVWKPAAEVDQKKSGWVIETEGTITLKEVPVVPFFTNERENHYKTKPPLLDLAYMQIELYQKLSRQEEILTYAGSPMMKIIGMTKPDGAALQIGPKRVIYCPPSVDGGTTDADFIQPAADNMRAIEENIVATVTAMREIAMQPTKDKSAVNPTATGQAIEAGGNQSTLQSWANALKDVLERAVGYTAQWLGVPETTEVFVNTEFVFPDTEQFKALKEMRAVGDLSQDTLWDEAKRRGILGPQFDKVLEAEKIKEEGPPLAMLPGLADVDPETGERLPPPLDPNKPEPKVPAE